MPPRHFAKGDTLPGYYRKTHGDDQFVRRPRRRQHVLLKFARGERPRAALGAQHHFAAQHRERQRQFRARIGVRDRTADRAFVAGLEMADEGQRRGGERQFLQKLRPCHQLVLCRRGADLDRAVALANAVELGDARNIDEHADIEQPQIEHRQKRLPTSENAGVVAVFGEQRHRLLDRIRPHVIERSRLHLFLPLSLPRIMAWMRRGVAGSGTSAAPSASAMALAIQTGVDMQLPSASPLAPSGVSGDGDS